MACVQRYAVGLILLVFLEFALSSHNHLPDLSEFESTERSDQDSVSFPYRQKRFISIAAIVGITKIASTLFGIGKGIYGMVKANKKESENKADLNAKLEQMQMSLDDLKQKMVETNDALHSLEQNILSLSVQLNHSLTAIHNDHRWLEGAILYAADVTRLKYILYTLNQFSVDTATCSLQPAAYVQRWAEGVTSMSGRSIGQVLYSMHDMVMGTTHLFGNTPLITLLNNTLDHTTGDYRYKLQRFAHFTFNLQIAGYFAWITAENVLNREYSVSMIEKIIQERFQEQTIIISLLTSWPAGSYGLPLDPGTRTCPSPRRAWHYQRYQLIDECTRERENHLPEEFHGSGAWPEGRYCILPGHTDSNGCPSGFDSGDFVLRRGRYRHPFTHVYCCRSDASPHNGIFLPPLEKFFLARYGGQCQKVMNMRVESAKRDYRSHSIIEGRGSQPDWTSESVLLCRYTPAF